MYRRGFRNARVEGWRYVFFLCGETRPLVDADEPWHRREVGNNLMATDEVRMRMLRTEACADRPPSNRRRTIDGVAAIAVFDYFVVPGKLEDMVTIVYDGIGTMAVQYVIIVSCNLLPSPNDPVLFLKGVGEGRG